MDFNLDELYKVIVSKILFTFECLHKRTSAFSHGPMYAH